MILLRNDPRPVVMTWMTVCIPLIFQRAEHHVGIHKSFLRVAKRARQRPHDIESKLPPQVHSRLVRGNDEIELHRAIAAPARFIQRVFPHGATDARTPRVRIDHISSIRDMISQPGLVRPEEVTADHFPILFGDESSCVSRTPIGQRLLA